MLFRSAIRDVIRPLFPNDSAAQQNIMAQTGGMPDPNVQADTGKANAAQSGESEPTNMATPNVTTDADGNRFITTADGSKIQVY